MVRFLAETIPAVTVCAERERAANGNHPVTYLAGVGVAHLHRGQRLGGGDLDHRQIGFLIYPYNLARAPLVAFRIGRELHVDLVCLFDHVVVSNDVAAGIDDEAGTERLAHLVTLVRSASRSLSAEEAVKEVLKVLVRNPLTPIRIAILVVVTAARGTAGVAP